jgi:7,8-dihydropterin-6-yl-methyl-4-(beta-D-ribofuranosyl)aminobenzene 5'-phosphate synthase
METIPLEPVDAVTVTTLVDNVTDLLLPDEGPATRPPMAQAVDASVPARFLEGGRTGDAFRAEHGLSCLVAIEKGGRSVRVLFDAGLTPDGLVENMRRLWIAPGDIDIVVLSHGHWDHTTGMDGLVRALGRANVPVLIHPDFWSRRRVALPGREPIELPSGFHLGGPLFEKIIAPTCDALAEFAPDHLVPSHCTGWRATHAIAGRFPDAFTQNSVGTRFAFTA